LGCAGNGSNQVFGHILRFSSQAFFILMQPHKPVIHWSSSLMMLASLPSGDDDRLIIRGRAAVVCLARRSVGVTLGTRASKRTFVGAAYSGVTRHRSCSVRSAGPDTRHPPTSDCSPARPAPSDGARVDALRAAERTIGAPKGATRQGQTGGPRVPASGGATESWGALGCVRRAHRGRYGLRRSTRSGCRPGAVMAEGVTDTHGALMAPLRSRRYCATG
jgi:hypothetical protein